MYLSRLQLDSQNRFTMKALRNPDIFHGAVERSFPGERQRRLWRIDSLHGNLYLMLLSGEKPDLQNMQQQFGFPDVPGETKDYQPFLDRIQSGSRWRFRLVANPTRSSPGNPAQKERGKVYAHCTVEQQKEWLKNRSTSCGFVLRDGEFDVVSRQKISFYKSGAGNHKVFLSAAAFEGVLQVTDPACFRQTLVQGIGREKAFGMGLLTIVRI